MSNLKKIVLDVLKPHHPTGLEFSMALSDSLGGCRIRLKVEEMDEKTESVMVEITGDNVDFEAVSAKISDLGGSIHSIDEVEVEPETPQP